MQDVEVYADLLEALSAWAHLEIAELETAELAWQPDAEGNNIAVTVWHFSRWLDVTARLMLGKGPAEELWLTRGWAERTGYHPQGKGWRGLGVVTGYTLQEVAEIPLLSARDLLSYLDQACEALKLAFRTLPSSDLLQEPIVELNRLSRGQLLQRVFMGSCGHMGEIEALKAMMKRACSRKQ
ncbi:MAG TPA: DinB family protein [Ktedonobacteraceae bacterium]|nr:DinB family protein [Ktedonobacteraceae bacterium]